MLEAEGREVSDATFAAAVEFAQAHRDAPFALQHALHRAVGRDDAQVAADSAAPRAWSFSKANTSTNNVVEATPNDGDGNDNDEDRDGGGGGSGGARAGAVGDEEVDAVEAVLKPVHAEIYARAVAMCREPNRTKKQRAVSQTQFWAESQAMVRVDCVCLVCVLGVCAESVCVCLVIGARPRARVCVCVCVCA